MGGSVRRREGGAAPPFHRKRGPRVLKIRAGALEFGQRFFTLITGRIGTCRGKTNHPQGVGVDVVFESNGERKDLHENVLVGVWAS
jgi:hypothetical protein